MWDILRAWNYYPNEWSMLFTEDHENDWYLGEPNKCAHSEVSTVTTEKKAKQQNMSDSGKGVNV